MDFGHEYFMRQALQLAYQAAENGEIPVGAIVVHRNRVIAKAYNLTETLNDVTAHAELQIVSTAAQALGGKYLKDCTLYVTLEPCVMCAGALYWSQLSQIVIGAPDPKRGYQSYGLNLHPRTQVIKGILETDCRDILLDFFKQRR